MKTTIIKRVLFTSFFILIFFVPSVSISAQPVNNYEQAVKKAEGLESKGKLLDAKAYYQMALKYKKDDAFAKSKIQEIIQKLNAKLETESEYYDIIDKADDYFEQNALDKALELYKQALKVMPGDDYAEERIEKIKQLKKENREKLASFRKFVDTGDELLSKNKFNEAILNYEQAANLFPEDKTVSEKIKTAKQLRKEFNEKKKLFDEKITQAERYLLINKFADALKLYEEAQKIFPGNEEVAAKIKELTPKAKNQLEYEKVIKEADELYISKNYAAAKEKYKNASKLWPENNYPSGMISRIEEQLAEQRKHLDKNYKLAVSSGDSLFNAEDYESAKAQYNLALNLKPGEQYPKSKLDIINEIYTKRKKEMQKQYASIIKKADSLFASLDIDEAKKQYELALSIRPGEKYPKTKLEELDKKSDELAEAKKLKMQYDAIVAEADKLYKDGHYDLAVKKYKEAQVLGSLSNYPGERIKEIQLILKDAQKAKEINESYNRQIILATRLKKQGDYEEAKKAFRAASQLKPAEKLPKEQISDIDRLLMEQQHKEEVEKKYKALMKTADSLYKLNKWEKALDKYKAAAVLKPAESEPKRMITKVTTILTNIEKEKQRNQSYNRYIANGDSLFKINEIDDAKVQYQQALALKPNENYPRTQINLINEKIKEQAAEREQFFLLSVKKGDNAFEQGNYKDALINYKKALKIKPDDSHCISQIESCNQYIAEINKKRQADYDLAIADADKLFAAKIYDKAVKNYRKAKNLMPEKSYPDEMIKKITDYIDNNSIVDVITEPVEIKKGETKEFSFEPIPVKYRKKNYFLVKAKNKTGQPVRVMITYGSKNGKNGGFVIKLKEDNKVNDYLIRVGNQYKWFSDDNNWIKILPQTGDVEIDLFRISKLN